MFHVGDALMKDDCGFSMWQRMRSLRVVECLDSHASLIGTDSESTKRNMRNGIKKYEIFRVRRISE